MTGREQVLLTGAAGVLGAVLIPQLAERYRVHAVDIRAMPLSSPDVPEGVISVVAETQSDSVQALLPHVTAVVHLATSGTGDPDKPYTLDLQQSRWLLREAAVAGVRRVVLASTNNVTAGHERDLITGTTTAIDHRQLWCSPRPDSDYAVAKLAVEAYGRLVADSTPTYVSCLRIGTVRALDDPSAPVDEPGFDWIPGGRDGRYRRFTRTWLYHNDLRRVVQEELDASDSFRLRYAVSDNPGRYWPLEVRTT